MLSTKMGLVEWPGSLMLWAFVTGLLLLAGAHYSASRHAIRLAYLADLERAKEGL